MSMADAIKARKPKASEQKIATLTVYVDATQSNSMVMPLGNGEWKMVIGGTPQQSMNSVRTAVAHEMGHFISNITREPSHNPKYYLIADILGDNRVLAPSEKYAWSLAHDMVPAEQFDAKMEEESVGTYLGTHEYNPDTHTITKLDHPPVKENPLMDYFIQSGVATKEGTQNESQENSSQAEHAETSSQAEHASA